MADSAVAPLLPLPAGGAEARGGSAWGVYLAVALTALGPVSFGYVLGFSSPAAAPLLASGLLTARQLNMFEALSPLGAIAGAGFAGFSADYLGRTRALALSCAPFALGWALISAAEVRAAGDGARRATPQRQHTLLTKFSRAASRRTRPRSSSGDCSQAPASAACSTSCRCTSLRLRRQRALAPPSVLQICGPPLCRAERRAGAGCAAA